MTETEILRMVDLLKSFREDIVDIQEERSALLFKQARKDLQNIYNYHLSSVSSFSAVEHYLKNIYTSFNYAAVIINDALKKKNIDAEKYALLDECLEVMIKCCDVAAERLMKKDPPPKKKK